MNQKNGRQTHIITRPHDNPYKIITECLSDGKSDLKSFYFKRGANFYVFSYENEGIRRHTFIDTGDIRYRNRILSILRENNIEPRNIERIIVTHRHRDHCGGVDLLSKESDSQILVHANFKSFIDGNVSMLERKFLGIFDLSCLREHAVTYLSPVDIDFSISIADVNFLLLTEPFKIGGAGYLYIFACPESFPTHTPDQLVALYSPRPRPYALEHAPGDFRPTDDIIFAGDLWLMQGPLRSKDLRYLSRRLRFAYLHLKGFLSGASMRRSDYREQDIAAKEALKRGFSLIRVKPGHGEEFLGTRIIPFGLLAERDILSLLGYSQYDDKSLLKTDSLLAKVSDIQEKSYASFVQELRLWIRQGYTTDEISDFLVRIYREQSGGPPIIAEDRRERRLRLKQILARLRHEAAETDALMQIAAMALLKLPE